MKKILFCLFFLGVFLLSFSQQTLTISNSNFGGVKRIVSGSSIYFDPQYSPIQVGSDPSGIGRGYLRFDLNAITSNILNNMTGATLVLRTGNASSGTNNVQIRELSVPLLEYQPFDNAYGELGSSSNTLLTTGNFSFSTIYNIPIDISKITSGYWNNRLFLASLRHQNENTQYVIVQEAKLEITYRLPVVISGSTIINLNSSSTFSATNWQTGYRWEVSSNLTINGANTNSSVSVAATGTGAGWVRVMSGTTELARLNVQVHNVTISGSTVMCPGSSSTFSATNWQTGFTWGVSSNLSINGANTNSSVSVTATSNGAGWVRVMSGSTILATHNVQVQTILSFINQLVATNTTVTYCGDINVQNVTVTSGAKLTLDAAGTTTIQSDFEVVSGSELEIK